MFFIVLKWLILLEIRSFNFWIKEWFAKKSYLEFVFFFFFLPLQFPGFFLPNLWRGRDWSGLGTGRESWNLGHWNKKKHGTQIGTGFSSRSCGHPTQPCVCGLYWSGTVSQVCRYRGSMLTWTGSGTSRTWIIGRHEEDFLSNLRLI